MSRIAARHASVGLLSLMLCLFGWSQAHAQWAFRPAIVSGKVVKGGKYSITISKGGTRHSFEADENTKITIGGAPAKLEQIAVDDTVTALVDVERGVATKVTVSSVKEGKAKQELAEALLEADKDVREKLEEEAAANPGKQTRAQKRAAARLQKERQQSAQELQSAITTTYDKFHKETIHRTAEFRLNPLSRDTFTVDMSVTAHVPEDLAEEASFAIVFVSNSRGGWRFLNYRDLDIVCDKSPEPLHFKNPDYKPASDLTSSVGVSERITFTLEPEEFETIFHSGNAEFRLGDFEFTLSELQRTAIDSLESEFDITLRNQSATVSAELEE